LEAIKSRIKEMEKEAARLKELEQELDLSSISAQSAEDTSSINLSFDEKQEVDSRLKAFLLDQYFPLRSFVSKGLFTSATLTTEPRLKSWRGIFTTAAASTV
jgi:hypothetical protein